MRVFIAFLVGLLFGAGLVISQMISPAKIIGFLDITGEWDPTLLVVMISALATTFIGYRIAFHRARPALAQSFSLPTKTAIDRDLLLGAGVFGVGWAMAGLCPGPGFSALMVGGEAPAVFVLAMLAGMAARSLLRGRAQLLSPGA